jgi:purine-binding chemotaxis protein CheW
VSEPEALRTAAAGPRAGESSWDTLARTASTIRAGADEEAEVVRELLVFRLDGSAYAVPVERVREIVRARSMTPVPHVPPAIRGVIVLRGEVLQIVDLRMRLSLRVGEPTRSTRILVLHGDDDGVAGVIVDAVEEVARVPEEQIRAAGGESDAVAELFLRDEVFVSILDLDRVLDFHAAD